MRAPRILIVILNYRTPALTIQAAESLHDTLQGCPGARLVIMDNGSGESSRESLATRLSASETLATMRNRIQLMCLPVNGGFAVGSNAAIRPSLESGEPPDYVWLLNSDTLVRPHVLDALVSAMESNPSMGIAGSRLENADETPQRSAFRFPTIAGEWEKNVQWSWTTRLFSQSIMAPPPPMRASRTDWVPGASMLIRRRVIEQIGLLDESFFMYFEDVDYCSRAADAGWETWYIPLSRVQHQIGATSSVTAAQRNRQPMPRYWFQARRQYLLKYHGGLYTACADAAWLLGFGIWRIRQWLERKPDTDPPYFWRDFFVFTMGLTGTHG